VEGPLEDIAAVEEGAGASRAFRPDFVWPALAARIGDALDADEHRAALRRCRARATCRASRPKRRCIYI
jgi:hypothetical protein